MFLMLIYDIPDAIRKTCPNPSRFLRPLGARVNLSCWIIPEQNMPWDLIADMKSKGATVDHTDAGELNPERLKVMCQRAIEKELQRIEESLEDSIRRATIEAEAMAKENTGFDLATLRHLAETGDLAMADKLFLDEFIVKQEKKRKAIIGRAKRALIAAQESAVAFQLLNDVEHVIKGVRAAVKAELEAGLFETVTITIQRPERNGVHHEASA